MPLIRVNAIFGAAPRLGPMYLIDAELGRAGAPRAPSLCQPWESVAAASVHAAGGPVWMRLSAMSVITASARLTRVCLLPRPRMMCCQYAKLWWMRLLVYRKAFVRFGSSADAGRAYRQPGSANSSKRIFLLVLTPDAPATPAAPPAIPESPVRQHRGGKRKPRHSASRQRAVSARTRATPLSNASS